MRVGIIGAGNMGFGILKGLLKSGLISSSELIVSDVDENKLARVAELGVTTSSDNRETVRRSDIVILAVKPDVVKMVLSEISQELNEKLLVSIAAGVSLSFLEGTASVRVIRMMPNLCAEVGEMAGCYSSGSRVEQKDEQMVESLFGKIGKIFKVDESLMDAVTGLSGSGPAFFFFLIQAVAEAGIELGLAPELAKSLAAQIAKGAAEMILGGADPKELVQRVCTPGGTTIEGMKVLESEKVAQSLKEATKAAARRAKELSR